MQTGITYLYALCGTECLVIQQMWLDAKDVNHTANNGQGSILKYVYLQLHYV
jgi:hypothetical protein